MKLPGSENVRWYSLVDALVATLVLLAVLQYRSVKAVSKERTFLSLLQFAVLSLCKELVKHLHGTSFRFQPIRKSYSGLTF